MEMNRRESFFGLFGVPFIGFPFFGKKKEKTKEPKVVGYLIQFISKKDGSIHSTSNQFVDNLLPNYHELNISPSWRNSYLDAIKNSGVKPKIFYSSWNKSTVAEFANSYDYALVKAHDCLLQTKKHYGSSEIEDEFSVTPVYSFDIDEDVFLKYQNKKPSHKYPYFSDEEVEKFLNPTYPKSVVDHYNNLNS